MTIELNPFDLEDLGLGANSKRGHPVTFAILELMKDGEWHDREEVIREVNHVIPHGVAYRRADQTYRESRMKNLRQQGMSEQDAKEFLDNPENYRTKGEVDTDFLVRSGRRAIIQDSLATNSRIERRADSDGTVWFRRKHSTSPLIHSAKYRERIEMVERVLELVLADYDVTPKRKKLHH